MGKGILMTRNLPIAALLGAALCVGAGCTTQSMATSPSPIASTEVQAKGGRAGDIGAVFVISQGLYYDTFVVRDPLPFKGRFQEIENGETMWGPGDPGYLGGRWWDDTDGDGVMEASDHFFLCPLLGPGRENP